MSIHVGYPRLLYCVFVCLIGRCIALRKVKHETTGVKHDYVPLGMPHVLTCLFSDARATQEVTTPHPGTLALLEPLERSLSKASL